LHAEVLHKAHRVKKERVGKVARQQDRADDVKSPATFLLRLGHFASLIKSLHVTLPPRRYCTLPTPRPHCTQPAPSLPRQALFPVGRPPFPWSSALPSLLKSGLPWIDSLSARPAAPPTAK